MTLFQDGDQVIFLGVQLTGHEKKKKKRENLNQSESWQMMPHVIHNKYPLLLDIAH